MTAHHRRRIASGALAALLTGLALATQPALATEPASTPTYSARGFGLARDVQAINSNRGRGFGLARDVQAINANGERLHSASRGPGAPVDAQPIAATGFDWTAAAIGAAGMIILVALATPALGVRRRMRPAP
jgi:hypothetical protein